MSSKQRTKQASKEALIALLAGVEPLISGDTIFIGDLEIEVTASGYANITLERSLDASFFSKLFILWDFYIEGNEASITVKPSENIFFYGDDGVQDVAFGPEFDRDLLQTVFMYIERNLPGRYPAIKRWLNLHTTINH
ncbi:MAG: hypothetical protein ACFFD8_04240 [Candidatus Thorarchaeota archaeon]